MATEPHVRVLGEDEYVEAARLVGQTMLGSNTDEVSQAWGEYFKDQTTHGAISAAGDLVGVCRWFPTEVSLVGRSLPAAGVTAVSVLATHRRQGHLRRLMQAELDSIAEAEVPIALLVAAEWGIYGRYGYGPAIPACGFELDAATARFTAPPTGTVEQVDRTTLRPHLETCHDLRWARTMGAVTRTPAIWDLIAGLVRFPNDKDDPGQQRGAIWRDDRGDVRGAVAYKVEEHWTRNRPTGKLTVDLLVGATSTAERELWRHLVDTDWVSTVSAGDRCIDDPLPLWLADGRAATQLDTFDCIWARLLDVPRVLSARRSMAPAGAVVEVVDELGLATGRYRLDLSPAGAEVTTTDATADVRLPVSALGAACFGGTSVTRLQEAGWIDEETPDGVARLEAVLRTPTAPWSPTTY